MRCTAQTRSGRRCKNEAGKRRRCRFHQAKAVYAKTPDAILIRGAVRTARAIPGHVKETWDEGKEPDNARILEAMRDVGKRSTSRLAQSKLTPKLGRVAAYGYIKADERFIRKFASVATRETAEKALYLGARSAGRLAPGLGLAMLGYDLFKLGKVVHEEYLTE